MQHHNQNGAYHLVAIVISIILVQQASNGQEPPNAKDAQSVAVEEFARRDKDKNGQLTSDEFVNTLPEKDRNRAKRDFQVLDWNQDSSLTRDEFLTLPGLLPVEQRPRVPDPVLEAALSQIAAIQSQWADWDKNSNESLDAAEFTASEIAKALTGQSADFVTWDLDRNGQLSLPEATRVVEVSFGVRRADGFELRIPQGVVFSWSGFTYVDADGDDFLTVTDLQQRMNMDAAAAEKRIAELDVNQDQKLSPDESRRFLSIDILAQFLRSDTNVDGLLDRDEWIAGTPAYASNIAMPVFQTFDRDGDQRLSFIEYRWTLQANPLAAWHEVRRDINSNGTLELNEFSWRTVPALCLLELKFFQRLDVNHDGHLDLGELLYHTPVPNPEATFRRQDLNQDGLLTLQEHQFGLEQHPVAASRRNFALFDWNRDGQWTFDEFRSVPGHTLPAERGPVPDPLVQLMESRDKGIQDRWSTWDRNSDGTLDPGEFEAAKVAATVHGMEHVKFAVWDLNRDGRLTTEELQQALRTAYGICRPTGESLRSSAGFVVNWMGFKALDLNHDDHLDLEECVKRGFDGPAGEGYFHAGDRDKDGKLSFVEWQQQSFRHGDPIVAFLSSDQDFDGLLTAEELLKGTPGWQKSVAEHVFPGFDRDRDEKLSLDEFRLTMLANLQEAWHIALTDRDGDGFLSLAEFSWDRELDSRALVAEFFERLDVSGDKQLDLDEYFFSTTKRSFEREAKKEFARRDSDKDGELTAEEFINAVAANQRSRAKRDFSVIDWNHDARLSREEFYTLPGVLPVEQRAHVPDPVLETAMAQIATFERQWTGWDKDSNESLDATEFAAAGLPKAVPGLQSTDFTLWDLDHNGQLSMAEATRVIDVSFGIRRTDGFALRIPEGVVFNWSAFTFFDADGDDFLSVSDIQKRMNLEAAAAEKRVADLDVDKDQKLSPDESRRFLHIDVLAQFLQFDRNEDGGLDSDEWMANAPSYASNVAMPVFKAFDRDGDQRLSFLEYRSTPQGNQLAAWHETRNDANANGWLELNEFAWRAKPALCSLESQFFQRLDLNHDDHLDLGEFPYNTSRLSPEGTFRRHDIDGDGALTLAEHLSGQLEHQKGAARRNFALFDWNRDGQWNLDELRTVPEYVQRSERAPIPDPVVELMESRERELQERWATWDRNSDKVLDAEEFTAGQVGSRIYGLENLEFRSWDLNRDGRLTTEELHQVLQVTHGICRPAGEPLRTPAGLVVNWMGFKMLDRNHDDSLDFDECVKHGFDGPAGEEHFRTGDLNKDGKLSFAEWVQQSFRYFDPVAVFLLIDRDLDGFLNQVELATLTPDWLKAVAVHMLPGFDRDADGKMSLEEFRLSPMGNLQEAWHVARTDRDGDGFLSLVEFSWDRELDSRVLTAEFFRRLDVNGDKRLDLDEYFFSTSRRDIGREFSALDKDRNGGLSAEEFTGGQAASSAVMREFLVFDGNADGSLTIDEYRMIPARTPAEQRLAPPDPVVHLAEVTIAKLEPKRKAADKDQDGKLGDSEFRQAGFAREMPGLQLTRFQDWDCDHDGSVSADDLRRFVNAAFGVRRMDGLPYREASGTMHNAMLYSFADENHDDRISLKEYLARGFGGPKASDTFKTADANSDGYLSYTEWLAGPQWQFDPIADFLRYDTDLDGRLSRKEVQQGIPEWQRAVAEACLTSFDDDRDGKLSLAEYRLTPTANLLTTWHDTGYDRDGDGRLSFGEFHTLRGVEVVALAHEYFRRFDKNSDGRLDLSEYRFNVDPARVPPNVAFQFRDSDHDSHLTLDELLVDLKKLTGNQDAQVRIGRIEEAFRAADANNDKKLSMNEFQTENGRATVNPTEAPRNPSSTKVARNAGGATESPYRLWLLIAVNVALVGGVAGYVLFKK